MNGSIDLPPSMFTDTLAKVLEQKVEELRLVDAQTAAHMLSITPQGFRKLVVREEIGHFVMGDAQVKRWSLSDIKTLLSKRRSNLP
jgi:hypothetical protein